VSAQGVLEPIKAGTATITATAEGKSATASVKVYPAQEGVISAGGAHACGVTRFGHAYCWGRASDGSIGIGDPIPMQIDSDHVYHFDQCEPKEVAGGHLFRTVSAGASHSCGITVDGDTYCWGTMTAIGDGKLNALSDGAPPSATSPVLVKGGVKLVSVVAGNDMTCGLTKDGQGYCWGSAQASHRLGNDTTDDEPLPTLVVGDHHWQVIRPGDFTVGLDTDGHAFQWGMTVEGDVATPTAVAGDHVFEEISVAGSRALGLDTDGMIWGWGTNQFGVIGDGTQQTRPEPTAVMVNGVTFKKLAIGNTSAAISTDNRLYWWGLFNFNETVEDVVNGNSRQQDYLSPADLVAYDPEQLVSGSSYVLGATADGTVAGIGMNDYGQLGVGCQSYATLEFLGSHVSSYELDVGDVSDQPTALSIDSGGKVTVPISVQRFGGFGLNGTGFPYDITLTVETGDEQGLVDATLEPSVLKPGVDHATLTVVAPETGGLTTGISVSASAEGDQAPHQSTLSVAVSGVVAGGVDLGLTCPDPSGVLPHNAGSPNRYQCMQAQAGVQAPGQYAGDAKFQQLTQHVWVDETVGDCIYWGHNYAGYPTPSQGFLRARNGGNSGAEPMNSALSTWGVLVKMSGVPEGGDEWLVFTDSADPQVRGLTVNMATTPPTIEGWNFQPMDSCPW
jgi:alpha-tubulin suppressor-like RCC1 family protein